MNESTNYPVKMMCQALDVSRSGFYAWKTRPQSARSIENDELVEEMLTIHKQFRKSYGSPRMSDELRARGKSCGRGRAERLMRENSIAAKPKKKFVLTTQADPTKPVAENLLDRSFLPTGPNQSWASDITYIRTLSGWLYLAVTMDLFSRKVVGWATSSKIDAELAVRALQMAIIQRNPGAGLLHHSDQGSQYASDDFQETLAGKGMTCSMSRRGNCWDSDTPRCHRTTV